MHISQSNRSVLAVIFTVLFLITGRLFVWKPDKSDKLPQQYDPQNQVAESLQTTLSIQTTVTTTTTITTTTETTTTVTTQFSRFELIPPDVPFNPDTAAPADGSGSTTDLTTTTSTTTVPVTTTEQTTEPPQTTTEAPKTDAPASAGYFNDALFIGDSRTVGIASYSPIDGATYFATVGLSTYKIDGAISEVPDTQGQSFAQVLGKKKYGKVYIMLGINELGMDFGTTMQNMDGLISRIRSASPGAKIILMGNLHVAAHRHYNDGVVNNTQINSFNSLLAAKADNQSIFYLDVNPVFDDASGCLDSQYTSDDTHPYAKYYVTWSEWLQNHTF